VTGIESDNIPGPEESASPESLGPTDTGEDTNTSPPAPGTRIRITATPIVGLAMLVIGLLVGYYARPLLAPAIGPAPAEESAADPAGQDPSEEGATANAPAASSASEAQPTPDEEELTARRQALSAQIVARVRHYRGDPDAPVTLVEFGDFQ